MMPKTARRGRIDYLPGQAALEALEAAAEERPSLKRQALLDHLVVLGALQLRVQRAVELNAAREALRRTPGAAPEYRNSGRRSPGKERSKFRNTLRPDDAADTLQPEQPIRK